MTTDENNDLQECGKILVQINNAEENISEWSREEMIGGFKWRLKVKKANQQPQNGGIMLCIFVACNVDCFLDKLWTAKADYMIECQKKTVANLKGKYFYNGRELKNEIVHPIKEAILVVQLTLKILRSSANNRMMDLDTELRFTFSAKRNNENEEDEAIEVEEVIPALAGISSYFQNIFFSNWAESSADSTSFTIKEEAGFDIRTFKLILYSVLAMGWMVHETEILAGTSKLVMAILKLCVKYDLSIMQNYCELYLSQSEKCPKMELLETAEQLGLHRLKEQTLNIITPLDFGKDLERNSKIRARLSGQTREKLDKRIAEKTEELLNEIVVKKRKIEI